VFFIASIINNQYLGSPRWWRWFNDGKHSDQKAVKVDWSEGFKSCCSSGFWRIWRISQCGNCPTSLFETFWSTCESDVILWLRLHCPLVKVMSSFDSASIVPDGFVTYTIKMAVQIAYFNACLCLDNSFISLVG